MQTAQKKTGFKSKKNFYILKQLVSMVQVFIKLKKKKKFNMFLRSYSYYVMYIFKIKSLPTY